ncbi:universal stress protein [Magnetospirillum sp. 15-1]|uniref:universal stress protein n=1 Tax=Magnetospirillum sp. 15-1 TaxID=1979370 RepID=UPI000BBCBFD1|nr:universal stress protein [Magnetospirillum sp. 15-1]
MKDILVAIGRTPSSNCAITVAAHLARVHGARLTALYIPPSQQISPLAIHAAGPALVDEVAHDRSVLGDQAREYVSSLASSLGIDFQWIEATGDIIDALVWHAHCSDIVVVRRWGPQDENGFSSRDFARLVTDAGRPIMIIPPSYNGIPGSSVTIGWNGSRGATRAVHDALPILRKAKVVELLIVAATATKSLDKEIALAIRGHLFRHGIESTPRITVFHPALGANHMLIDTAKTGTDLLVMGAFGRPRIREIALGSVTKSVVENSTVPILLSF